MATVVEGDQKAPFIIATTQRCSGGTTLFLGLLHFTIDTYIILLSVKPGVMKYHFLGLWYDATWDWTQISRTIGKHSTHKPIMINKYLWQNFYTIYIYIYIFYFLYISNSMAACLRPLVSCRLYSIIIRQKMLFLSDDCFIKTV